MRFDRLNATLEVCRSADFGARAVADSPPSDRAVDPGRGGSAGSEFPLAELWNGTEWSLSAAI
jgi:hypothetical protein